MRKIFLSLLLPLSFFFQRISAQPNLPQFGVYSEEEINMTGCSFEKDAEAVVLLDEAYSDWSDNYQLVTTRRIRIKILNERGLDRGNITIPFYSKEDFEFIKNIEGYSFYQNSMFILNKKSIYTEKVDDRYSNIKFALPNVKVGSIIEYKYVSVMKSFGGLDEWLFQSDIPTLKSCFLLHIIPDAEFSYVVSKKSNYPVVIKPIRDEGKIYFEMNNIPSLRFEPYMDAVKDYLQKVEFQLAGYVTEFGSKRTVNTTWKDVAYNLATEKELGGVLKKDLSKTDEVKALVAKETTAAGKITAIYDYVRNNFTWNGYYSKYAVDGLKKVWENRTGTTGEINLLLVNLLQNSGIECYPIIVAERDYGKIDPKFPLIDRFNKTVAYVIADGKTFILDATQKYCPAGLTPYPLLNTYALVINKKTTNVIEIASEKGSFKTSAVVKASLDQNGLLTGKAEISDLDYAKVLETEEIRTDEKKFVHKKLETPHDGLVVQNFSYDLKDNAYPLQQHIKFSKQFDESGGYILLNYNLFTGLQKNPFTKEERFTNINFGFPYDITVEETIEIPANAKVEGLPINKKLKTPDNDIYLTREIKQTGNSIQIKLGFVQTITLVDYDSYPVLKDFYKMMVDLLNEPVTIKLNSK
jgi:transglutaminase-like putative cysteine protease